MRTLVIAVCVVSALSTGIVAQKTTAPSRPLVKDHYVAVKSTIPAIKGQTVQLYVRERMARDVAAASNLENRVVLFVHGAGTPAEVAFDVPYGDYSWMAYLAENGFDAFSMDTTGYGRSTRPLPMNDPCNLSPEQQSEFIPSLIPARCTPTTVRGDLSSIATDWDDIDAVVNYIKTLRHVERVHLVAWSLGGPRAAGYAAQHPNNINRMVLLAAAYTGAEPRAAATSAFDTQSRVQFVANWDRQVGCSEQYEPKVSEAVWSAMLDSDPVGATWGPGVRRAPSVPGASLWTTEMVKRTTAPTLLVSGIHDKQVDPSRVRQLHADLGSTDKVFVDLGCSSHNAMWERNHRLLFDASKQWLMQGSVNGMKQGTLQLGYPSKRSTN